MDTYSQLLKKLNPAQKEAVETIEGPVMVIAGPGTGKTQILTLRIAQILEKTQVSPGNILALTFSESAAFEMRKRLSEIIGTPAFRVEIATFHSFCNDIIKNYPESFPNLLSFESITEVEQIELVERIITQGNFRLLRPFGEPLHYVREALSSINDLKKEGVSIEEFKKAVEKQGEDFTKTPDLYHEKGKYKGEMKGKYITLKRQIEKLHEFITIYENYQKALIDERKYDFNDMLLGVVSVLEKDRELLLEIQERYQYILVDEHQDTNATQNKLLELLANFHEVPNLFVVGDEKQAIYRFQGASLENFLYFQKLYPGAKLIYLDQNYRSQQTILDAASQMISHNVSANILPVEKVLQANSLSPLEKIKLVEVEHYFDEYSYIAQDIGKKINSGTTISEIAILGRRNTDLLEMANKLERKNIPFSMDADQDIFSDLQIQKLLLLLSGIADLGNDTLLAKMLHIDFLSIDPLDIYTLLQYAKIQKKTLYESLLSHEGVHLKNEEKIISLGEYLSVWKTASENKSLDDFFIQLVDQSGFRTYMLSLPTRYQTLEKLTGLYEEIKMRIAKNKNYSLQNFLDFIAVLKKHNVSLKSVAHTTKQEGVRLLTVHKSKGLEFDYVYILNCFDGRWGSIKKRAKGIAIPWEYLGEQRKAAIDFADIEDERRLFYVGLTRARKDVTLIFAKQGLDGKEQLPSQFLEEIEEGAKESVDISTLSDFFIQEREALFQPVVTNSSTTKEKEYITKLFLEKGLSPTALDNYLVCPWKFFYRNLLVLPDIKTLPLIFGSAIHKALEYFIKNKEKHDNVDEVVVREFIRLIERESIPQTDKGILFEKGKVALPGFIQQIFPTWNTKTQSELLVRGVKLSPEVMINGRLDMLEFLDETHVRVHDFKTGKPKPKSQIDGSKESSKYNYLRQLIFYKLLLERYHDGKLSMHEGVIDFVEPDEKGIYHTESFSITKEQVESVEMLLKNVANEILSLAFWDTRCDDKECEYCKLRSYMN